MEEEENTSDVQSTAGRFNDINPLESLLARASGTSTHNAKNRQSTGSTFDDAGLGLIPIYSSLDHRRHQATHNKYFNQSSIMSDGLCNDYETNEESRVNFDSRGVQIQVSNSKTYKTPFGPVRNSVGVQMSLGFDGLSLETNESSSISNGNGRVFLLSSGGSRHSPFSPFGQMSNRYHPLGLFSSPFSAMFSAQMHSTSHRSEHFPFESTRASDDDLNQQNVYSSSDRDYHGPIITELSSSEDEEEKNCTNVDKRNTEGKTSYDEDDKPSVDKGKTHERPKYHENIGNVSDEDLKEFDTNDITPNSSATNSNDLVDDNLPDTDCGLRASVDCDVTQSALSKNENNAESYKDVNPNQSVPIDTNLDLERTGKSSGRRKRSFRTQSFVNTPLPFADMVIVQSESNQDTTENHVPSPEPELGGDGDMELNSEISQHQDFAEKVEADVSLVDLNLDTRIEYIEDTVNTKEMPIDKTSTDQEIISNSIQTDKCSFHMASLNTDERIGDPGKTVTEAAQPLNHISDADIDNYECNKQEINESTNDGSDTRMDVSEWEEPEIAEDDILSHSESNTHQTHIRNTTEKVSEFRKQMQQNATNQDILVKDKTEWQYSGMQMYQYSSPESNYESPWSTEPTYKSRGQSAYENDDRSHKTTDIKGNHNQPLSVTQRHPPVMNLQHAQVHVHVPPEQGFDTCSGHKTENGRQFLLNICTHSFEKSHKRQQSCKHDIVHMYHTSMNTEAYMCQACGLVEHFKKACNHCHHHGHAHDEHLSDESTKEQTRNKNASVKVNKLSTELNSEQILSTMSSPPTSNKTAMTDTYYAAKDGRQNKHYDRNSDGLSSLIQSVGLIMKDVIPDGNCLFNAITDQLRIRGDFSFTAKTLRAAAVEYLRNNPNQDDGTPLVEFLDEHEGSWEEYLNKMSRDGYWGDHIGIYALANVVDRRIVIYRGNNELASTIVEPRRKITDAENDSSDANSGGTEEQSNATPNVDEMRLGHVSDSHYVSLRPVNWKEKLMQELKNKKTSCLIGCNPESAQLGCNTGISGTRSGLHNSLFDENFLINYIKRGDFFRYKHQVLSFVEKSDMTVNRYLCDQFETYRFTNRHRKSRNETAMAYFISPTDTKVRQVHTEGERKDLVALKEGVSVGKLKLLPVVPYLWKSLIVPDRNISVVKHASIKSSHNLQTGHNRDASVAKVLAFESEWPEEANEWKSRERDSGWPDSNLIDRLLSVGVHVIPASDGDDSSNNIWEYNFYAAEFQLYKTNKTEYQCLCCLLKHVVETVFCGKKMINNRHLSAVVLYMLEKFTEEDVNAFPAKCLLYVVDEMLEHLKNGHFPCYFIRGKNLIADMCYTDRAWHIDRLNILKKHLIVCLYFTLDEAGLTGEYFDFENVLCGIVEAAVEQLSVENVGNTSMEPKLAYLVPLAVRGIQKWAKTAEFEAARELINVWFTDLVENCHQVGLSKDVFTEDVLFSLPDIDRWLFSFYNDCKDGTNTLENACYGHECASISVLYGKEVVPLLQKETAFRGDDLFVPTKILLGDNLVAFAHELRTVMREAGEGETVYQEAIHYFLKANTHDLLLRIERERMDGNYRAESQLRDLRYLFDDLYASFEDFNKLDRYRDLMDTYEEFCNYYSDVNEFIKLSDLLDRFGETGRAQEAAEKARLVHDEMETYV